MSSLWLRRGPLGALATTIALWLVPAARAQVTNDDPCAIEHANALAAVRSLSAATPAITLGLQDPSPSPTAHTPVPASSDLDAHIRQALGVAAYTIQDLVADPGVLDGFRLRIRLDNVLQEVEFAPVQVRSPNFRALAQDDTGALLPVQAPPESTYRGTLDIPNAAAVVSLTQGQFRGTILVRAPQIGGDPEAWCIQPLSTIDLSAPRARHIVYRASDATPGDWRCGVADIRPGRLALPRPNKPAASPPTDGFLVCEIAIDADFAFYQQNSSSVSQTISDVENVIAAMSSIYEADVDVTFQISQIIVRTSAAANPYSATDPFELLVQFRTHWNANHQGIQRDVAHLFTGVDLIGNIIGVAYLSALCEGPASGFGYGLSQSRYTTNMVNRVGLTAHELGHNFSAPHCAPGSAPVSICDPCTIMCPGIGGCTGNLASLGCSASWVSSYAAQSSCLSTQPGCPAPSWHALGSGMNGDVTSLTVYGAKLVAGGLFTIAGGVPAERIAAWDGSSWSAPFGNANAEVEELTVYNGQLAAGGHFTTIGNVNANRVALWNGLTWMRLPNSSTNGTNGSVRALYANGTNLYVGGRFTSAGGVPATNIALWTGSSWQALGGGLGIPSTTEQVQAITIHDGYLIAAGKFTGPGSSNGNIAYWTGSWQPLGGGLQCLGSNDRVMALATFNGDLYVGGRFTISPGGAPGYYLVRWVDSVGNGSWVRLIGQEPNSSVYALLPRPGILTATGAFTSVGPLSSTFAIAAWNGSTWSAYGTGPNNGLDNTGRALTTYSADLVVGGEFLAAGGGSIPAARIARWGCPPPSCYADCDSSGSLTVADFGCFQTKFVAQEPYADCNGDGQHTVADFGCFQTKFVAGCP